MCFHIGKVFQVHLWSRIVIKPENERDHPWKLNVFLPICSYFSPWHLRLPPSSDLFRSHANIANIAPLEVNLFGCVSLEIPVEWNNTRTASKTALL